VSWVLDRIFGGHVRRETGRYLRELAGAPAKLSREQASRLVRELVAASGPMLNLGQTDWGELLSVPITEIVNAHGIVTGGTGSGKTMFALLLIEALMSAPVGFGVLDPKGDLFRGALVLLKRALDESGGGAAKALRKRIAIIDFAAKDPLSSYNVLARWPGADPDFFAGSRSDLLFDLLPGPDRLSLPGASVLHRLLALLSVSGLPLPMLSDVLHDERLRRKLVANCGNPALAAYFRERFPDTPKSTIAAIERRMDALFSAESVRLALSGTSAPDLRRLQDEGRIVLVSCFGENLSRGVSRTLQALVLSDIRHAVFARRAKRMPFLWVCDEAQNFFLTERLRENMAELLAMSRSFGTHFLFLTQNITSAVADARTLRTLHTNTRWSLSMRGEPDDAAFLRPALPATGRKLRPTADPFAPPSTYTPAEERTLGLEELATLPDRVGWLWLKTRSPEALKIRTRHLDIPSGDALDRAIVGLRNDPTLGQRLSRRDYERRIAERRRETQRSDTDERDVLEDLAEAYRRTRKREE
jgi:hypothetical protein